MKIDLRSLIAIASLVTLAGCRSPFGGQAALKADLSLSFIVSGAERLARDAVTSSTPSDVPGARARLLLPTVTSLSVTLTPESGGDAISADPVSIVAGAATVPVSLGGVPYGRYTVKAEAKDATGGVRFTQTSPLVVGDPELSVTLNLVPTDAAGAALAAATLHDIDISELPAGEAKTWLVAPGSRLLAARSIFLSGLGSDARVYLQMADGTLVSDPLGTGNRLSTVNLPAGEPAYLTVYNGSVEASLTSRAFPGPAMVDVPAGAFQRDATETNVSHVSAFSMADLEVTRELYLAVMGTDPSDNAASLGQDNPIQYNTWYDALEFCNKASLLENLEPVYSIASREPAVGYPITSASVTFDASKSGYRLPTEAEWEWAAMGATVDARSGGIVGGVNTDGHTKGYAGSQELGGDQGNLDDYAWHNGNSPSTTQPVGKKLPNELGLYDMSGNVYERCWDQDSSGSTPTPYAAGPLVDPDGGSGQYHISRGGAFSLSGGNVAQGVSHRPVTTAVGVQWNDVGFRVARGALPVNLRGGLVGEWLLDGNASDTSGLNAPATVNQATPAPGRSGVAKTAMRLGAGQTISIDAPAVEFSHSSSFSISLWFNAETTLGQYPYLLSELGVPGDFNYFISFNDGTINACVGQNNQASISVNAPVSAGSWYHVVQVYNSAAVSLYMNGVFIGSETNSYHPTVHATTDLVFGAGGEGASFEGYLDDVRVYNRVLTTAEIQALYTE